MKAIGYRRDKKLSLSLTAGIIAVFSLTGPIAAYADVKFLEMAPKRWNEENYPESSFTSDEEFNEAPASRKSGRSPASVSQTATQSETTGANTQQTWNSDLQDSYSKRKGVQELGVLVADSGFYPQTLFVHPNVPVRLYLTSVNKKTQCFMQDDFKLNRRVRESKVEEISFTPKSPGVFRFYCPLNKIEGSLVVRE